jgi:DNA-binding winged helix-turn-helix (wHTH) protein/Tol biopolymer transport system component
MATPAQSPSVICFGPFELDAANVELRKAGVSLKIHPQPFQVLLLLAGRPKQIVTREEIRSALWGGNTFVDFERGINSCINQIRAVMGDDPEKPRYIETVPRRGYRFIAAVSTELRVNTAADDYFHSASAALYGNGERSSAVASVPGLRVFGDDVAVVRPSNSRWMLVVAGCVALVLVIGAVWWIARRRAATVAGLPDLKQIQLTANSSENAVTGGAISPDGKYLAYSDAAGIHIKLVQNGDTRDVPQPEILKGMQVSWSMAPNWAGDGARIIATASVPGRAPSIWSVPVIGGAPHEIREDATATGVTRDGAWVAFTTRENAIGDDREIWMMTADGEQAHKIYDGGEHTSFAGPEWSPDGKRMAYVRHHEDAGILELSLETRDLLGGAAVRVLPTWVWDLNWAADGRLIYSLADPGPMGESCSFWGARVDARTGSVIDAPRRLTHWAGTCMDSLSMTEDGKRMAFRKWWWQGDVFVADVEDNARISAPQRLTLTEGRSYPAAWTPDGGAVIFGAYRDGQWGLFKQAVGTEKAEFLATVADSRHLSDYGLDDAWSAGARVSPDGAWVLFLSAPPEIATSASTTSPTRLMRVAINGGAAELVMMARTYQGFGCARAPATLCAIGEESADSTEMVFSTFDAVKGRGREIARCETDPVARYPSDYIWDLSPDGSAIAILRRSEPEIRVMYLNGTASRTIAAKGWNNFQSVNWTADGKGLIVASATAGGATLLRVDLRGKAYALWERRGNLEPGSVALDAPWGLASPDGRRLAIYSGHLNGNMWMMENF